VPARDAPNVEISKSLEWDVSHLEGAAQRAPAAPPRVRAARRAVTAPTEVMLPALRKQQPKGKDRSETWLLVGLLALVVVILALLAAVIVGVVHRGF